MPNVARLSVALTLLLLAGSQALAAQEKDSPPGILLRFGQPPLRLTEPAALRAPWLGARTRALVSYDSAVSGALDSARLARATSLRQASIYGVAQRETPDTALAPPPRDQLGLGKYADLALDGQARLDIRTERVRNERCTAAELSNPNAGCGGGIRAPRLDNHISVRSGGIISRRVHVAVDFETDRDFSANNNLQVYYEGLEDEIVRRVEVGTVTFRPPPSRFLTAAVPRTNFGVNGLFEVGPMQFQALFATQKGSSVTERTFNFGGGTSSQPQDRAVRDLDFESGRFFWVADPTVVPGYPAVDILSLDPTRVVATELPAEVRVYRYRAVTAGSGVNPNLGGIRAFAVARADTSQHIGRAAADEGVQWELLIQGRDYYLDQSGLWFVLASKLDPNDYLAVSYVTRAGTVVGTFPEVDRPQAVDTLALIVEPRRGPEAATFRYEMRQVYRVAGTDLQRSSLSVEVSLNRSERPASGLPTYLAQLGLSVPTDPNVFDRENRLFPRPRDPGAEEVVRESYIVFPHLTPFADPARLSPTELSDSLYATPLYLLLSQGPPSRFQLRLRYDAAAGGERGTLSLNALQIKQGSEQLTVNGVILRRDVDYSIDYGTGQVTFIDPDGLFGNGGAQVVARFEQQNLFAVAPTSIVGLTSRYSLGEIGSVNLIGVFQREASTYNRPQLGFEAKANLVGGASTDLRFRSNAITKFLNRLTPMPSTAPSLLDINAELAFSRPDPNRSGAAYLEEFEAEVGTPISLREQVWEYGSAPQRTDGLDALLGVGGSLDPADAVALTWQNLVPTADGQPFQLRAQDIDTTIVLAGRGDQFETAMFVTVHADTSGGIVQNDNSSRWTLPARPFRPRWRSMVTPLSATGLDLSRSEYLEFWVFQSALRSADSAGVQIVVDLGSVNEDALAIAPDSLAPTGQDTLYFGRQYVGTGELDTERDSVSGIFNAETDDIGILADRPDSIKIGDALLRDVLLCNRQLSASVPVYPWGDLSARCTNGNGHLDTEDLNSDNLLNATGTNENVFRYVVDLRSDRYKVPNRGVKTLDASGREFGWTLYRVPLRGAEAIQIGTPNLRLVQHLRLTMVTPPDDGTDIPARFAVARMRFVGAPWVRRAETPIAGISGATGEAHGEIITAIVSTENVELGYTSPPGTGNLTADRNPGQGSLGTQINEKSLRLIARDLAVGERAEAYLRFPAGPQNLLNYRELRVWARGYGEGWERGDLEAFVKLGSDDRNFYLYRAPAKTTTWEPEFVIDLDAWRRLRAVAEARWLNGDPPSGAAECGGDPTAYVVCEGPYLVHVGTPGVNPPNLAAVQELSAGLQRVADLGALPEAEVWIDDIRLLQPASRLGKAIALDARLAASDVGDISVSFIRQDGQFRQIGETPTYRTNSTLRVGGTWRLDRFLPASLGIAIPASVSLASTGIDPQLIGGTDIEGAAIANLRRPSSWNATYSVSVRRNRRGTSWLTRGLLDPLSLTAAHSRASAEAELSRNSARSSNAAAAYNLILGRAGPRVGLGGIVPGFLRGTELGKSLSGFQVSFAPTSIRLGSALARNAGSFTAFQVPVERLADSLILPTRALTHIWRNSAGITLQPLTMLTASGDLASTRDLRHYGDSTAIGRLAGESRRAFAGLDVGVERDRQLTTALLLMPRLSSWLRPRYNTRSSFVLSRSLTSRPLVRADEDTLGAFILPQTLNNNRSNELGASVDIARLVRVAAGDSAGVTGLFARVRPFDISTRLTRSSTYDLASFDPSVRYQLGLGGREDFIQQDGVPALGLSEVRSRAITTGADLPLGLTFTLTYGNNDALRFYRVGSDLRETRTVTREWPVGSVRWSRTFRGGPVALLALGTTFRRREGTTTQPALGGATVASGLTSSTFAPDLQMGLRGGLALTFRMSDLGQRTENNGVATLLDQSSFSGSMGYSFRMPEMLSRSRKRLRTTVTGRADHVTSCLRNVGEVECSKTISETVNQELTARFETDLAQAFQGSLDFGYTVSEAKHLDRRISTMFLTVGFQLALFAGNFRQ